MEQQTQILIYDLINFPQEYILLLPKNHFTKSLNQQKLPDNKISSYSSIYKKIISLFLLFFFFFIMLYQKFFSTLIFSSSFHQNICLTRCITTTQKNNLAINNYSKSKNAHLIWDMLLLRAVNKSFSFSLLFLFISIHNFYSCMINKIFE